MTLRCKPGDLVILGGRATPHAAPFIGTIRRTVSLAADDPMISWYLDPPTADDLGEFSWCDRDLTPIRGLPETETTQEKQPCTA